MTQPVIVGLQRHIGHRIWQLSSRAPLAQATMPTVLVHAQWRMQVEESHQR